MNTNQTEKKENPIITFIRNKSKLLSLAVFLIALFFLFINNRCLSENPFKEGITWEDAVCAVAGSDGRIAVIDSFSSRVSIVTEENELCGTIGTSWFFEDEMKLAGAMAFSDRSIYVLDLELTENGNTVKSQRILEYSLKGKKQGELYHTPEEMSFLIRNIYWKDGKCYTASIDLNHSDEAAIGEINGGELTQLHRFSTGGADICEVSYNPEIDTICIITYDGRLFTGDAEGLKEYDLRGNNIRPSHAVINDYHYLVALDSSNDKLYFVSPDGELMEIASTYASSVSEKADYLVFADTVREEVSRYDSDSDTLKVYTGAAYTTEHRAALFFTYLSLFIVAGYLIMLLAKAVIRLVRVLTKKTWDEEENANPDVDRVTIKSMVTKMIPTFVMCYVIAAFLLATIIWNTETGNAEKAIEETAVSSMYIVQNTVSERLREINSEKDYQGEAYQELSQMFDFLCGRNNEGEPVYGWSLYKFPNETTDVMAVVDLTTSYRVGEIIVWEEQEGIGLSQDFAAARRGEITRTVYNYKNGMELMWVMFPVLDQQGNVLGAAALANNYSVIKAGIVEIIQKALAQMLVLMAGFLFLLAEIEVGKDLARLQMSIVRSGDREHTLVEGAHTLEVISDIGKSISVIFLTLIAADITAQRGIHGAVYVALPFTLQTVFSFLTKGAMMVLPSEKTKKAMTIGGLCQAAGATLGIAAVYVSGFALLCTAASLFSIGSQITAGKSTDVRKMGQKITDRYDDLEYHSLIAPPIGTAIGAVCRTYFGNTAIFILLIVISMTYILMKDLFVGKSQAVVKKEEEADLKDSIRDMVSFVLRPGFFVWLLCILLPTTALSLMSSYVLPVMVGKLRASDIYIAAITVIIVFITMYVLPSVNRRLGKMSANIAFAVSMVLLGVLYLVFAKVVSLECFAVIVLAISILSNPVGSSSKKMLKQEVDSSGAKNVNTESITNGLRGAIKSILPTGLTLVMSFGAVVFGLAMAGFLLAASVVVLLFFRKKQETVQ